MSVSVRFSISREEAHDVWVGRCGEANDQEHIVCPNVIRFSYQQRSCIAPAGMQNIAPVLSAECTSAAGEVAASRSVLRVNV